MVKKCFIIGCGPSFSHMLSHIDFCTLIKKLREKKFTIICMSKILRYLDTINFTKCNLPQHYIASDALANISMYDDILRYSDLFEFIHIAQPHYIDKKRIQRRKDLDFVPLTDVNFSYEYITQNITKIKSLKNYSNIRHNPNSYAGITLAYDKLKCDEIYFIGIDETYDDFSKSKKQLMSSSDVKVGTHFTKSYLKENDVLLCTPVKHRIETINSSIHNCEKNAKIYNLSNISMVGGDKTMSIEKFLELYINE